MTGAAGRRAADELAAHVVRTCTDLGLTLATAESLTGGLVAATVVDVPGASRVLRGGVVAYAPDVKRELLGVDAGLLERVGTVDEGVARQMAEGARRVLGSAVAVATTGVAGPGAAEGHPAGTVWIACLAPGESRTRRLTLTGDRAAVRSGCRDAALTLVLDTICRSSAPRGTVVADDEER